RRGRGHGPAPPHAADRGPAVPSRERAHAARRAPAGGLPRAAGGGRGAAMTLVHDARARLAATLEHLLCGGELAGEAAEHTLADLLSPAAPAALQAAVLTALRAKGETPAELAGFARGLLQRARRVPRAA